MNAALAICTATARNYLPQTRVLAESLGRRHPDLRLQVAVIDAEGPGDGSSGTNEPFDVVHLQPLNGSATEPGPRTPAADALQVLACRAKPRLLATLLDRGYEAVVFLDPDVFVVNDLSPFFALVRAHPIVLSPHVLRPPGGADRFQRELALLRVGTFNGGCIGVHRSPQAAAFVTWWRNRLDAACAHDLPRGVYFDQRWLDLAPAMFSAHVCRDAGCNVAYWNLPERPLTRVDGQWLAAGVTLRFMHFSGFDQRTPEVISRHSSALRVDALGPAQQLFAEYAEYLRRCDGAGTEVAQETGPAAR